MTITLDPEAGAAPILGLTTLPLTSIAPGGNPRRHFSPAAHAELVASIRQQGVLQPLLLRPNPDDAPAYRIVAGERRYRAAIEALGPDGEVPVLIRDLTDLDARIAAIAENDDRDDTSETEQADAAAQVLADCDGDRAEAARLLSWSPAKLARRLALAGLSEAVKTALDERRIKLGHAELLAAVPADKQDVALQTILGSGLDVGQTRAVLMRMTHSLAVAVFDKGDCTTCPSNSAQQRALFETCVDDGHCTNPGCFQLKTEAAELMAEQARAEEAAKTSQPDSGAASGETEAATASDHPEPVEGPSTPDSSPGSSPDQGSAPPTAPVRTPAAPKKVVTAGALADKATAAREKAWRVALAARIDEGFTFPLSQEAASATLAFIKGALDGASFLATVAPLAEALEIDLRQTWSVDKDFLAHFDRDELKFIAQECGLADHLGDKVFGRILGKKGHELIAGLFHASGFDWAGRLPSAMTLDGEYGAPPEPAQSEHVELRKPTFGDGTISPPPEPPVTAVPDGEEEA